MHSADETIIALLTDFGTTDYYVGSVKGVILSINPNARIVDITHDIPPQDIEAAAFVLLAAHATFPAETTFVAVVDPGVGSARRPILVQTNDQFFVGPDNGLFSYLYDTTTHKSFHVTNEKYFRHPVAPTFHGRDVFGPVAAYLSREKDSSIFGPTIDDEVRLPSLSPTNVDDRVWRGRILHIDHFGNCITNIGRETLSAHKAVGARLTIKGKTITSFRRFFTEVDRDEELFALWGSAGFLEIAALKRSAAQILNAKRGDLVTLEAEPPISTDYTAY